MAEVIGYTSIVTASLIWSLTPALVSRFRDLIRPLSFTSLRAAFGALTLLPIVVLGGATVEGLPTTAAYLIAVSGFLGPGLGDACYVKAIQVLGGSLAVIVSYTYIFIAQAMSVVFLGESLRPTLAVGSSLAFLGVLIATLVRDSNIRLGFNGILYSLVAATSWSLAAVMIRVALNYADVLTVAFYRLLVTLVAFLILSMLFDGIPSRGYVKPVLPVAAVTGVLGFGLGVYLFVHSINTLGVSVTTMATSMTPVLSQIMTRILSRERPSKRAVIGALATSCGIAISAL